MDREYLESLNRREIQQLAKERGVDARKKVHIRLIRACCSCFKQTCEIIELLLESGADPTAPSNMEPTTEPVVETAEPSEPIVVESALDDSIQYPIEHIPFRLSSDSPAITPEEQAEDAPRTQRKTWAKAEPIQIAGQLFSPVGQKRRATWFQSNAADEQENSTVTDSAFQPIECSPPQQPETVQPQALTKPSAIQNSNSRQSVAPLKPAKRAASTLMKPTAASQARAKAVAREHKPTQLKAAEHKAARTTVLAAAQRNQRTKLMQQRRPAKV